MKLKNFFFVLILSALSLTAVADDYDMSLIEGDWFSQIDIPQNKLTIILEFNLMPDSDCIVNVTWRSQDGSRELKKTGKAKYRTEGSQLLIEFLNEGEWIRTDHVFDMLNRYDFYMSADHNNLIITNSPQFRRVDVTFGKGYSNRGFSKIIFD